MARLRFPVFSDQLSCFNCSESLAGATEQDKEYPDGYGRYRRTCPRCGYHTYYDHARQS